MCCVRCPPRVIQLFAPRVSTSIDMPPSTDTKVTGHRVHRRVPLPRNACNRYSRPPAKTLTRQYGTHNYLPSYRISKEHFPHTDSDIRRGQSPHPHRPQRPHTKPHTHLEAHRISRAIRSECPKTDAQKPPYRARMDTPSINQLLSLVNRNGWRGGEEGLVLPSWVPPWDCVGDESPIHIPFL